MEDGKEKEGKVLYDYQVADIDQIFSVMESKPKNFNLLYQLPTGGGKTVIFSEITKRYIEKSNKKVLILTHRIELSRQTSNMLDEFKVKNKVINSQVKELPDQAEYMCFVAMVETLNNRLQDDKIEVADIGLVIIDEAHYNSFRKLFKYFNNCFILGVTATPLSSNIKLPMKDSYGELIVGSPIETLISKGFLAKAVTYSYEVGLGTLKIGTNGDYTVRSSEVLYTNSVMQGKLLYAYKQRGLNKKTLIFNNGINTSIQVAETFVKAGLEIRHLDNTHTKQQRKDILQWFKEKPNAILTSVGILTTGFDEPTVETIILNRATKSLALYFQMIGRGSRVLKEKKNFTVIDLGNNAARFGLWSEPVDWQRIFMNPDYFLENLISDEDIERSFKYTFPEELQERFKNSTDMTFDINAENAKAISRGDKSSVILDTSREQHVVMVKENAETLLEALSLMRLLDEDIRDRIRRYSYCICKSTANYRDWLTEDYKKKLKERVMQEF